LEIEAELQKKLTKAVPYLRGQLCKRLGLRMAPELRFYRDNTEELLEVQEERAAKYMDSVREERMQEPKHQMIQTL